LPPGRRRSLFAGGQSAVHPDDLKAKVATLGLAEVDAVRQGMNAEICRQAGTQAKGHAEDAIGSTGAPVVTGRCVRALTC
jgi:hypothetical protein